MWQGQGQRQWSPAVCKGLCLEGSVQLHSGLATAAAAAAAAGWNALAQWGGWNCGSSGRTLPGALRSHGR